MIRRIRRVPFAVWSKQQEFLRSAAWCRGFVGGRGTGKTKIGAADIILGAKANDPCMAVSPSFPVFIETTWPTFVETAKELGVFRSAHLSPVPNCVFGTQDGGTAQITFRSGEKPESLRGPNKARLWLDEASVMSEAVFQLGIAVLRYRGRMGRLTMTFTPKGRRHWTFPVFYRHLTEGEIPDGPVETFSGERYDVKVNTHLIGASTRENPFLPEEFYSTIRDHYTTMLAEQELEGRFVDIIGLMFLRENFGWTDAPPVNAQRVRYWDKAGTAESENPAAARSAGVLMSWDAFGTKTIEDVIVGQWSALQRENIIYETAKQDAKKWNNQVVIYTEQEPGSGGKESAQQTIRRLAEFPVFRHLVSGRQTTKRDNQNFPGSAKVIRAQPLAAQVEAGNVQILRGRNWVEEYLTEMCAFPEYTWCDQVDASSGAYNMLAKMAAEKVTVPQSQAAARAEDTRERWGIALDKRKKRRR